MNLERLGSFPLKGQTIRIFIVYYTLTMKARDPNCACKPDIGWSARSYGSLVIHGLSYDSSTGVTVVSQNGSDIPR